MKIFTQSKPFWIYGVHAVQSALDNPKRQCHRLIYLHSSVIKSLQFESKTKLKIDRVVKSEFLKLFPQDAVHQGIALQVNPLQGMDLEDILTSTRSSMRLITLDQITDPHNFGAIARSAAAFDFDTIVMSDRHSPPENSASVYKTSSGALEHIPIITVTNLARALDHLKQANFWNYGLDEEGTTSLDQTTFHGRVNLVLGAEGKGLRRLTKESCDYLIKLPTGDRFSTLNASCAAAVSLYEVYRQTKT